MIDWTLYAAFLVAAVVLVVIPGPDMMFIVAIGARNGPGAGLMAAVGVAVGLAVHTAAAALGLAAALSAFPLLYNVIRWVGAAYLVYLAIQALRAGSGAEPVAARSPDITLGQVFRRAVTTNLLNPKVTLFNVTFLPQFVNPALGRIGLQFLILGLTLIMIDLIIDGSIGLFAGGLGQLLRSTARSGRYLDIFTAIVFAGLATRLVLAPN